MTAFDRVKNLCNENGIKISELERILGIGKNASYKWKKYSPASDTLFKLSEYFGVSTDYILTGEQSGVSKENYYDIETEMLARELQKNKELKAIFDVAKGMPKERLDAFYNLLKDLK